MQSPIISKLAISYFVPTRSRKIKIQISLRPSTYINETKTRDTFSLVNVYTGTTLIRSAKFLKHGPSKHIGDDIDVDTSAKTDESDGSSATLSKVPSPIISLWSKPPRVTRLSP